MTETPTTVAVQPALPTLELPDFEGVKPVGVVTKLNGAGQRIARAMHIDEKVVLVVEAQVSNVGHGRTGDGVKRIHVLSVLDVYELEGKPGAVLLRSLRAAHKIAADRRDGKEPLDGVDQPEPTGEGLEVRVDSSGVVLTDVEAAEARGEILPGLPVVDAAVVVFEDGTRALWPDDWPDAVGAHPEAGDRAWKPGSKKGAPDELVRQILDPDTGETLEEWTDAMEAERLAEEEREAREAEAAADRDAAAALEVGRGTRKSFSERAREATKLAIDGVELEGVYSISGLMQGGTITLEDGRTIRVDDVVDGVVVTTTIEAAAAATGSPELVAEEPADPIAFYRIEYRNGSLVELTPHEYLEAGEDLTPDVVARIVAVTVSGVEVAEAEATDPAGADEPAPSGAPGPFDGPDDELELDDEPGSIAQIVEDDEGFADVVRIPTSPEDVALLDGVVAVVKNRLAEVGDRDRVLRLRAIEERGKARKGVLEAADRRAGELVASDVPRAATPAPEGFEPPEGTDEVDEYANPEDL